MNSSSGLMVHVREDLRDRPSQVSLLRLCSPSVAGSDGLSGSREGSKVGAGGHSPIFPATKSTMRAQLRAVGDKGASGHDESAAKTKKWAVVNAASLY